MVAYSNPNKFILDTTEFTERKAGAGLAIYHEFAFFEEWRLSRRLELCSGW